MEKVPTPEDIVKVRRHHKQAYQYLSSALEADEKESKLFLLL